MKSEHSHHTQPTKAGGLATESPQLLSLLALAAGAVMMPQTSEADVVYTNLLSPEVITPDGSTFVIDNLPGTARIQFIGHTRTIGFSTTTRWVTLAQQAGYVRLKTQFVNGKPFGLPAAAGKVWDTIGGSMSPGAFAGLWIQTSLSGRGHFPDGFTDMYYAFRFRDSTQANALRYGWMKVDLSNSNGNPSSPILTLYSWAYDTTGAQLPMGQGVLEPSSAALLALGALTLGAKGLRNWRRNRPSASQS